MAAPVWFVQYLEALRGLPGSRPTSAKTLAEWAAQVGDGKAPSRPTISRWLNGTTLPTSFEPLELVVVGVREHTRSPTRHARETLLRVAWWRSVYDRARAESGRDEPATGHRAAIVYQGLAPFAREDADRFFGRGAAIEILRSELDELHRVRSRQPLIVLGQAAVGKSSLLAAGLLPVLERRGLPCDPAATRWSATIMTPGRDPLAALSAAMGSLRAAPSSDAQEATRSESRALLVVDQFEEVLGFTDDVQRRFLERAVAPADPSANGTADACRHIVMIVCRFDYRAELSRLAPLRSWLNTAITLAPLTADELTEAIKGPARQAGITVGNDLINRLFTDAGVDDGAAAGGLPLVSQVLRSMNEAGPMTVRAYERLGGIDGVLAHTATAAWERIQSVGLDDVALAVLVRLVRVGDSPGHDVRAKVSRHELIKPGSDDRTARALGILTAERLTHISHDSVQIIHDALLRAWPRLRDAIDIERTDHLLRQSIETRARQWTEAGRPTNELLRGDSLIAAHRVADVGRTSAGVHELFRDFLESADRQERRQVVRQRRLLIAAVTAVVVILLVGTVAIVEGKADYQINRHLFQAEVVAQAKNLERTDSAMAAQLYLTAYRMRPDPDLYTALLETSNEPLSRPLRGHHGPVRAVSYDGSTTVSGGEDGTIRLWPIEPGRTPASTLSEPGPVTGLVVDQARHVLVSAALDVPSGQGALRVWDIRDPGHPEPLTGEVPLGAASVAGLALGAHGTLLLGTTPDGDTRFWNLSDPTHPVDLGVALPGGTKNVKESNSTTNANSTTLAVAGSGGALQLWDISSPTHPIAVASLPSGAPTTHAVAFDPTREILASGAANDIVRLWDTTDPAHVRLLSQPPSTSAASVLAITISPDGSTLAAASANDTIKLWNITDPARPIPLGQPLLGHTRGIAALAFSPDGRSLSSGSADGTVRVWSLPTDRLVAPRGDVTDVAFDRGGRTLAAAGGADATVHLWDLADPEDPVRLEPGLAHEDFVNALGFTAEGGLVSAGGHTVRSWDVRDARHPGLLGTYSVVSSTIGGMGIAPDGRSAALGTSDGSVQILDMTDPTRPVPRGAPLSTTPNRVVSAVQFSPDGRMLATGGADDKIRLWDTSDPTRVQEVGPPLTGHSEQVFRLSFSSDGRLLASVGADHTTRIWDVGDPTRVPRPSEPLIRQADAVGAVSWSPRSRSLATGSDDSTVALWNIHDAQDGEVVGAPIEGHTDSVYAVDFSPDGRFLSSAGRDRTVQLWDLDVNTAIRRICSTTADSLTPQAWNSYVSPDQPYDPPCRGFPDQ